MYPGLSQPADHLAIMFFVEESPNPRGNDRPHVRDHFQFVFFCTDYTIQPPEVRCDAGGSGFADLTNPQAVDLASRRLSRLGIDDALAAAGATEGDTVRIGDLEFEYREPQDWDEEEEE